MIKNKICSLIFAVCVFFLILTLSIALPIYIRPFYYLHITPLGLENSGFTYAEIVNAYNAVLDYLTLPNKEFSAGVMRFSVSGADHFADCKTLISLNMTVLLISVILLTVLTLFKRKGYLASFRIGKHSASFYGAVSATVIPAAVGVVAAINFTKAFDIFHQIFFKGKDNWIFDRTEDQIIKVLPEVFFRNCAIFIGISILTISLVIMIIELKNRDV